ncbi:hypothetical protein Dimus_011234 [Dionaea muscipula]
MGSYLHEPPGDEPSMRIEQPKTADRAPEQVAIHICEPSKVVTESFPFSETGEPEAKSKNCPCPEIARIGPCPNKPPKIPINRGLSRISTNKSRPKSRFGEPSWPVESSLDLTSQSPVSPYREEAFSVENCGTAGSRRGSFARGTTSRAASSSRKDETKEGPDEKEVYQRVTAQLSARNQKRMTVKLMIELSVFLCLLGCLVCSLTVDGFKRYTVIGLDIWKWFLLLLVIFSGMLITHWIVHVAVFFVEWKFLMRKNVLYFTHGLKTSVEVFIWITVVLATWVMLIKPDVNQPHQTRKILEFVTWTIVTVLIGAFLWLVKTTLLKILASSFHLNRFFDRIQESVFHHSVLQTLAGRPVVELAQGISRTESQDGAGQVSFMEHTKTQNKKVVDVGKLHQMKQEKVPAWTMQLLVDVVSNSGLSTMSGMLDEDMVEGGVELDDDEITNEEQAIATAVRIFDNIVQDKVDQSYIDRVDLHRFLIWEEVDHLFPLFEVNEKGQISLKAFAKWVVKVYNDQAALKHALNDNKTAVKQLNKLVTAILIVMMIVIWLIVTGIATTKLIVLLSSQLVVAAFIFGNTCKTIFEAIIFVFVMHPFDVGDRCVIDGNKMLVEEMNILTTVFLKWDKEKVYYPNSILCTKAIGNFFRSPDQGDVLEFSVDFTTPVLKIGDLKDRIKMYLEQNLNFWHPQHNMVVKEIENVNKIKMALFVNHTINFQDFAEKNRRRSELVLELKKIFEELDIKYNLLPQEISIRNM